ncbi:MAG TPA: hypothetical protein VFA86_12870 [Gammaproteobacteria bacterium]|nr:hypothetical protein [Gammaproteobacteria bacterium]
MRKHHTMAGHLAGITLATLFLASSVPAVRHLAPGLFGVWARLLPGVDGTGTVSLVLGAAEAWGLGWYFAFLWRELRTERGWAFRERHVSGTDQPR